MIFDWVIVKMNKDNHFEYISLNTCPISMFLGSFWRVTRGFSGKIVLRVRVRVTGAIPAGLPMPLPKYTSLKESYKVLCDYL